MTQIPAGLAPSLVPLAWLVGTWRGVGVGGTAEDGDFRFGQEVTFTAPDDGDALAYSSSTWVLDDAGGRLRPLERETGFWRLRRGDQVDQGNRLEVDAVLAHDGGVVEVYLGSVDGAKIELSTDVVARTAEAAPYTAGHRLYGHVEGDLLYAYDAARSGAPLRPYLSARLKRD